MLAVVKTPRTEIALNGDGAEVVLAWLKRRFPVEIAAVGKTDDDELVNIEETDWAKRMNRRLLAGYRLKVGLTQKQLAALSGIRQTVISEYETGRRPVTLAAAEKLAPHLNVAPETLIH